MNWNELKNNIFFKAAILLVCFSVGFIVCSEIVIGGTTKRVLQRLQKEYSPSPYGPGLDPDKLNPNVLRKKVSEVGKTWSDSWEEERLK